MVDFPTTENEYPIDFYRRMRVGYGYECLPCDVGLLALVMKQIENSQLDQSKNAKWKIQLMMRIGTVLMKWLIREICRITREQL